MLSFIFGWVNFAIFFGLVWFAYRRSLREKIRTMMKVQKDSQNNLQIEAGDIENQALEVAIDLLVQKRKIADLLEKVQKWQLASKVVQAEKAKIVFERQQLLDQKNQIKAYNLTIEFAQQKLLDSVLDQASFELNNNFIQSAVSQNYLNQALDRLN